MLAEAQLAEIEARAKSGWLPSAPWRAEEVGSGLAVQSFATGEFRADDRWWSLGRYDLANKVVVFSRSEAEFIAHAREDIPALIAEVRRLREWVVEHWKERGLNDWENCAECGAPVGTATDHAAVCFVGHLLR